MKHRWTIALLASGCLALAAWLGLRGSREDSRAAAPESPRLESADIPSGAVDEPAIASEPSLELESADIADRVAEPAATREAPLDPGRIVVVPSLGMFALTIAFDELASTRAISESGRVYLPTKCDGPMHACCFDDLPAGRYAVVIETPSFQTWRKEGVEPGSRLEPALVGSAALRVEVIDGASGAQLAQYELELQPDPRVGQRLRGKLHSLSDPPAQEALYRLPPGDWVATVRAPEFGDFTADVLALRSKEIRELRCVLLPPSRISGWLFDSAGRPLAFEQRVKLYAREDPSGSDRTGLYVVAGEIRPEQHLAVIAETNTASDGAFAFDQVPAGHHLVRTLVGPDLFATAEVELVAGHSVDDVLLELPACAWVDGRVLAPPGASFEHLAIRTTREQQVSADVWTLMWDFRGTGMSASVPIAADGAFRLGPVAIGSTRFAVQFDQPPRLQGTPFGPPRHADAVCELREGNNEVVVDLRDAFPGRIVARITVDGHVAVGLQAEAREPPSSATAREDSGDTLLAVGKTDQRGIVELFPIRVGSVELLVWGADSHWLARDTSPRELGSAERLEVELSLALIERELLVIGAQGTPLKDEEIMVSVPIGPSSYRGVSVQSDELGMVRLRLPAGTYHVGRWIGAHDEATDLVWPTEATKLVISD